MPTPLAPGQMARYRGQPLDLGLIPKLLNCGRGVHPENALAVKNYIDRAKRLGDYGPPFLPCALNHPQTTSCLVHILRDIFPSVTRWVLPVYIPLTFLPPLLFKYSTVKRKYVALR